MKTEPAARVGQPPPIGANTHPGAGSLQSFPAGSPAVGPGGTRPVLIVGPVPPPYHGGAVFNESLLRALNGRVGARPVLHLDTTDRRTLANLGRLDVTNAVLALRHAARLAWLLARHRPAVVYLPVSRNEWAFLRDALLIALARLGGARVVTHLHGSDLGAFYRQATPAWRWLVRRATRAVSAAAVLSPRLRDNYDGLLPPERVFVAPVGVDDLFPGGAPERGARPAAPVTVAYLGTLAAEKGVLEVLQAVARLRGEGAPLALRLAGEWSEPAEGERARAFVAERGLGEVVRFEGSVSGNAKRSFLEEADVLVFPSVQREGLPLVVLEAMSAALPVVATSTGAVADAVLDGETGWVVPVRDTGALAGALRRLMAAPAERLRLGKAGRHRFEAHFTSARAAAGVAELLEDACGERGQAITGRRRG